MQDETVRLKSSINSISYSKVTLKKVHAVYHQILEENFTLL